MSSLTDTKRTVLTRLKKRLGFSRGCGTRKMEPRSCFTWISQPFLDLSAAWAKRESNGAVEMMELERKRHPGGLQIRHPRDISPLTTASFLLTHVRLGGSRSGCGPGQGVKSSTNTGKTWQLQGREKRSNTPHLMCLFGFQPKLPPTD